MLQSPYYFIHIALNVEANYYLVSKVRTQDGYSSIPYEYSRDEAVAEMVNWWSLSCDEKHEMSALEELVCATEVCESEDD
jgi:hypothetical protein